VYGRAKLKELKTSIEEEEGLRAAVEAKLPEVSRWDWHAGFE
jgi:hypothetical protein